MSLVMWYLLEVLYLVGQSDTEEKLIILKENYFPFLLNIPAPRPPV